MANIDEDLQGFINEELLKECD
jgi:hypothetical protein